MSDPDPPKRRRAPRPKYQVFISSTEKDLREARREVTWEILKARHIPAGMEAFPATHDRGWKVIQQTIDVSDYYIVVVAGRYGTTDPTTGISWTEREYDYAKEKMNVLAFIREMGNISADHSDDGPDRVKLDAFKQKLRNAHHCAAWTTVDDLRAKVTQALQNAIQDDEDSGAPRLGWYRGDEVPSANALDEFARLSAENSDLKSRLSTFGREALLLTREAGAELSDLSATMEKVRVDPPRDKEPVYRSHQLETFLNDRRTANWALLEVHNTGTRPARNVVADFVVGNAMVLTANLPFSRPATGRPATQPKSHVYIDDRRNQQIPPGASVRQRIEVIAVGGYERLIPMGFRPYHRAGQSIANAVVRYSIRSEDGAFVEGEFKITSSFVGEVMMSYEEAFDQVERLKALDRI